MGITTLLATLLPGVISDTLKRVLPAEKMSDAERAQLEQELTLAVMAQDWKSVEAEFADRSNARLLAEKDVAGGNAFTTALSALVRPAWGFGALILVAYSVIWKYEITGPLESIVETVIWFFFGGRVIEKVTPHVTSALAKK